MRLVRRLSLIALPFFVAVCGAKETSAASVSNTVAQEAKAVSATYDEAALMKKFSKLDLQIHAIQPSDMAGIVELHTSSGVIFASNDGSHFIAGTLYSLDDNGGYKDVLAERQAPLNAAKIASFSDSVIEFKAENEKHVITVFTDITCGYCVRLHSQMNGYNDLGITVRYMAYPRQGPTGNVAEQMATVWCAADQRKAMHDAKIEREFGNPEGDLQMCKQTVSSHYKLGRELNITGTPAIFLSSGELIAGYVPPAQLLERLEQ